MAGWISRHQNEVIEYHREENRVLKQQLGRRRLRLTDDQRRRLAVCGKAPGRRRIMRAVCCRLPHGRGLGTAWSCYALRVLRHRTRDTSKFSTAFKSLLADAGVEVVRLPYRSPNLNAHA